MPFIRQDLKNITSFVTKDTVITQAPKHLCSLRDQSGQVLSSR